eukprot:Gb_32818 [translate_table: standard]
MISYNHNISGR